MPTIDQLKKQYNKLSTRERYALMMAAHARGDELETKELLRTAPRKIFSYANTSGLQDGFRFVCMMHIMSQLGHAAGFYFVMLANPDDEPLNVKIGDETFTEERAIELLHRNIIGGRDAFRMLCEEYKLDPSDMLKDYPFIETIEIGQALVRLSAEEMETTDEQRAELKEYTRETLETYRAAIAHHAKGWE
jgi:hypothetical protein